MDLRQREDADPDWAAGWALAPITVTWEGLRGGPAQKWDGWVRSQTESAAALRLRAGSGRRVVHVAVDVQDVQVVRGDAHERLGRADDDAAIAADQEGDVSGLLQDGGQVLAEQVPDDAWPGPASDRRDGVVGEVAGDREVAVVDGGEAGRLEPFEQADIAVGARVVLVARGEEPVRRGTPRT